MLAFHQVLPPHLRILQTTQQPECGTHAEAQLLSVTPASAHPCAVAGGPEMRGLVGPHGSRGSATPPPRPARPWGLRTAARLPGAGTASGSPIQVKNEKAPIRPHPGAAPGVVLYAGEPGAARTGAAAERSRLVEPRVPSGVPGAVLCPSYSLSQSALLTPSVPSRGQGGQPVLLSLRNKKEQRFREAK